MCLLPTPLLLLKYTCTIAPKINLWRLRLGEIDAPAVFCSPPYFFVSGTGSEGKTFPTLIKIRVAKVRLQSFNLKPNSRISKNLKMKKMKMLLQLKAQLWATRKKWSCTQTARGEEKQFYLPDPPLLWQMAPRWRTVPWHHHVQWKKLKKLWCYRKT